MFIPKKRMLLMLVLLSALMIAPPFVEGVDKHMTQPKIQPIVVQQFIEKAKKNTYWKMPFITGEHEQIVFMTISSHTNPNNEVGEEVHPFDQAILIVEGEGSAVLNKTTTPVGEGDLIFIPKGTVHNVINNHPKEKLKIISFYSDTDMPADAIYKRKADELKSGSAH